MKTYIIKYHAMNATDAGIAKINRLDGEKMAEMTRRALASLEEFCGVGEAVIDSITSIDNIIDLDD